MKPTGIADEAGSHIDTQIRAHKELGWDTIESRIIEIEGYEKGPFHDIPDEAFEVAAARLDEAGIGVCGVGSTIGNWGHSIDDDFKVTLDEIDRCIPRMERMGCTVVRIMSYAILEDGKEHDLPDQKKEERFRRVREIKERFGAAGITAVHENCMNYGGMSIAHALDLQEHVPGLKWVFDTANPAFNPDRSKPLPYPRQDAWEFYQAVKDHIAHVHIKDGRKKDDGEFEFTLAGEGDGHVRKILTDLKSSGYDGYLSIEPHTAVVFHDTSPDTEGDAVELARQQYDAYVTYGRAFQKLLGEVTG